jgi:uncharacterized membrane protein
LKSRQFVFRTVQWEGASAEKRGKKRKRREGERERNGFLRIKRKDAKTRRRREKNRQGVILYHIYAINFIVYIYFSKALNLFIFK